MAEAEAAASALAIQLAPGLAALALLTDRAQRRAALLRLSAPVRTLADGLARLASVDGAPAATAPDLLDAAGLAQASDALARRHPTESLTLLAVELDALRPGHEPGSTAAVEAVLGAVAAILRAQSRPQDAIARDPAGRFVVALGGPVSTTRALLVAERLRAAIEAHDWAALGDGLRVTASVGVAARTPGASVDDALARADAALQACRRAGRNQVRSTA